MLLKFAAAATMLLAGSALAEPQKAAPPCPKVDFTAADVVRGGARRARFGHSRLGQDWCIRLHLHQKHSDMLDARTARDVQVAR